MMVAEYKEEYKDPHTQEEYKDQHTQEEYMDQYTQEEYKDSNTLGRMNSKPEVIPCKCSSHKVRSHMDKNQRSNIQK